MGPYWPLNIPTLETRQTSYPGQGELHRALANNTEQATPCQANYLQPQSDFCFSISTPHPRLSPSPPPPATTNDSTWTWFDLPLTSHNSPPQRWRETLLVFLRDGNQKHLCLLTSVPVSESQPMFVLIPASSTGPGSQSFDPVNIEF